MKKLLAAAVMMCLALVLNALPAHAVDYTLNIQIDPTGVERINSSGQEVTITKQSTSPGNMPVVWLAFPAGEQETVNWPEEYGLYSSFTEYQRGATISINNSLGSAEGGYTYTFADGIFKTPGNPNLPEDQYGTFLNDSTYTNDPLTMGLFQVATVNGGANGGPLNAAAVLYNETADFTPIEKINVFLLSEANNGLVISEVSNNALLVDLTTDTTQTIYFDDNDNQFKLGQLPS